MSNYGIGRSQREGTRLSKQHDLLVQNMGFVLHPSILEKLTPQSKMTDVGTGTGAVLSDVAQLVPKSVQLDGFDISPAAFPPSESLPANMAFHVHDAREPFASALHGQYDVVHLRLLVAGLEKDDWEVVLQNVLQLLRPGGAIQWIEADFSRLFEAPLKGRVDSTTNGLTEWGPRVTNAAVGDRRLYGWSTLEGLFQAAGLEGVVHEIYSSDRIAETREANTAVQIGVCESMASLPHVFEKIGGEAGLSKMRAAMAADHASGAYTRCDIHVFLGVKPMA